MYISTKLGKVYIVHFVFWKTVFSHDANGKNQGKCRCKRKNPPISLIILSILKNYFPLCIHHFSKYFSKITKARFWSLLLCIIKPNNMEVPVCWTKTIFVLEYYWWFTWCNHRTIEFSHSLVCGRLVWQSVGKKVSL